MSQSEKYILFIPTYNCSTQVLRVLARLKESCAQRFQEIIVVDNRSKDDTVAAVQKFRTKEGMGNVHVLINDENYGLGGSHKVAFEYGISNGFSGLVVLHGDDQGDASDIPAMLDQLEADSKLDAVLGNRFDKASKVTGYSAVRIWGNVLLNFLFSVVLFRSVKDLGAGVNAYRLKRMRDLDFGSFSDYCDFNFYLLLATLDEGWKMKYQPIIWREEDQVSNTNAIRMGIRALKALFGWRFRRSTVLLPPRIRTFTKH